MKRIFAAMGVAVVSVAVLAGCGGSGSSAAPTVTVVREVPAEPAQPVVPAPQEVSSEQEYLDFIRSKDASFYGIDDATSLETGYTICKALDSGMSLDMIVSLAANAGLSPEGGAGLIAGAVLYLCPEHADSVRAQL